MTSGRLELRDLAIGLNFLRRLPAHLRHPLTLAEADALVRERRARRTHTFLALMKRAVYEHSGSPYRRLLDAAAVAYEDVERLAHREGVEATLAVLFRQGVYLTSDEFKGRTPVVRNGVEIAVDPDRLRNPLAELHVTARSSGSRSGGTPVLIDLAYVRDCAVNTLLFHAARGGERWVIADWEVPGGGAMFRLLKFACIGDPPARWFSHVDPGAPGLHPRYRWSARTLIWASRAVGRPLPPPLHVSPERAVVIAQWMASVLRSGRTPFLFTFPSSAVRVCQAAHAAGIDLPGARSSRSAGSRLRRHASATIARVGANAAPRYGSIETGPIGYACLAPQAPDEVHVLDDLHALIQRPADAGHDTLPENTLLVSTLRPAAPFIMLNVSMGDQGSMSARACGCPLEEIGWTTHLSGIRSYEKLTGAGMTFRDTDVIRILEEVLPARFGGAPTDYQLVEEEGESGEPRLRLLVHPAVGPLEPGAVENAFLSCPRGGLGCGARHGADVAGGKARAGGAGGAASCGVGQDPAFSARTEGRSGTARGPRYARLRSRLKFTTVRRAS